MQGVCQGRRRLACRDVCTGKEKVSIIMYTGELYIENTSCRGSVQVGGYTQLNLYLTRH